MSRRRGQAAAAAATAHGGGGPDRAAAVRQIIADRYVEEFEDNFLEKIGLDIDTLTPQQSAGDFFLQRDISRHRLVVYGGRESRRDHRSWLLVMDRKQMTRRFKNDMIGCIAVGGRCLFLRRLTDASASRAPTLPDVGGP